MLGYVPNPAAVSSLQADHAVPVTFRQRFFNTLLMSYNEVVVKVLHESLLKWTERRPHDSSAPVSPALLFVNGHYNITDTPSPRPPNVVNIGGIHLKPVEKIPGVSAAPLPELILSRRVRARLGNPAAKRMYLFRSNRTEIKPPDLMAGLLQRTRAPWRRKCSTPSVFPNLDLPPRLGRSIFGCASLNFPRLARPRNG